MAQQLTPWQVLMQRDFGLFWASLLFSAVGSQISTVAIAWQVYEITNSPFQLGLAGLFRTLPIMLLSIPGGVVADRMDRRRFLTSPKAWRRAFSASPAPWLWAAVSAPPAYYSWPSSRADCARSMLDCQCG